MHKNSAMAQHIRLSVDLYYMFEDEPETVEQEVAKPPESSIYSDRLIETVRICKSRLIFRWRSQYL